MIIFSRSLPAQFDKPLPQMMAYLTPPVSAQAKLSTDERCRLADAVAAWHLTSPLGICLRRSLLRYYFLREANLPVSIIFGARLKGTHDNNDKDNSLGGHAWLELEGQAYFENPNDYEGFVKMYVYPKPTPKA